MNRLRTMLLAGLAACATIVSACSSGGGGTTPQPPAAPTGLAATAGDSAVALAWTASSGATSYKVYRATATGALATKTAIATVTTGVAYTDTDVTNSTTYYYQVTASNAAGESAGSNEASARPLGSLVPIAPTGVTATPAYRQVTLLWDAVPTATSYTIYWATAPGVTTASASYTTTFNGFLDAGLTNGTTYYYRVSATNGIGESALSAEVSATPNLLPPFIAATVLRWTAPAPTGVPIVQIRVCTDPTCSTPVSDATVTVNSTSVPWNAGRQAYESSQVIAPSEAVALSVTIPAGDISAVGTYTATGTMYATAPTVTAPTTGAVWDRASDHTVTWTAGSPTSTTPASIYVVGVQDAAGVFYPVNDNGSPPTAAITASSFLVPAGTLPAAGSYTVFVGIGTQGIVDNTGGGIAIAGATAGSGLYLGFCSPAVSFTVTAPTPAAPTGLTARGGPATVSLAWTASTGATSYGVYRSGSTGGIGSKTLIATVTGGAVTYDDTTVTDGSTYFYQVVAINGNGDSPASSQVSATPGPLPYVEAQVIHWATMPPTGFPIRQARVCTDTACSARIAGATVTVNSAALTWNASREIYESSVMVAQGATVDLVVTVPTGLAVASGTYTASGTMYTAGPTLSAPTNGATWAMNAAQTISWSGGAPIGTPWTSVYVLGVVDGSGTFYPVTVNNGPTEVSIATLSWVLPANSITVAGTYTVFVGIGAQGISNQGIGGGAAVSRAATGSGLYLGDVSSMASVTVN